MFASVGIKQFNYEKYRNIYDNVNTYLKRPSVRIGRQIQTLWWPGRSHVSKIRALVSIHDSSYKIRFMSVETNNKSTVVN